MSVGQYDGRRESIIILNYLISDLDQLVDGVLNGVRHNSDKNQKLTFAKQFASSDSHSNVDRVCDDIGWS